MPVRRVRVIEIAQRGCVPWHAISPAHGHHGHIAVDISVDRPLDVGIGKSAAGDRAENSCRGNGLDFVTIELVWIGNMGLDVVIETPALVFIDGNEHGDKRPLDILWAAVESFLKVFLRADQLGSDWAGLSPRISISSPP